MAALEGAEEASAAATGMAAVNATLMCQLRSRQPGGGGPPACSAPATTS